MSEDDSSVEVIFSDFPNREEIKGDGNAIQGAQETQETSEKESVLIDEEDEDGHYHDPMNLLELLETRPVDEDSESENELQISASGQLNADGKCNVQKIMAMHEWTFPDYDNPGYIYCLYCDCSLKAKSYFASVKHENSLIHRDRTKEYLNFLNDRQDDIERIKSNVDFSGDTRAVKAERQALDEEFKNYAWAQWTQAHEWLVRVEGAAGYCKYCRTNVNLGNSHARRHHEDGNKHKENQKKGPKRRATISGERIGTNSGNSESDQESTKELDNICVEIEESNKKWYEKSKNSSDLCRCKLCDISMFEKSYRRHTLSNLHKQNLTAIDDPGVSGKLEKPDWAGLQEVHPWITEDPENFMEAYCKYCKKHITHGTSAARRLIHEHSASHRAAAEEFSNDISEKKDINVNEDTNENDEDKLEDNGDDEEKENVDCGDSEGSKDEQTNPEEKARLVGLVKTLKTKYSWAKPYKKDPSFIICQYCKVLLRIRNLGGKKHEACQRHREAETQYLEKMRKKLPNSDDAEQKDTSNNSLYPWLVKSNLTTFVFCKYCRYRISHKANRSHHEKTVRHQKAEKAYMEKLAAQKQEVSNGNGDSGSDTKSAFETKASSPKRKIPQLAQAQVKLMKTRIIEWQKRFVWLQYERGLLHNYVYCNFCKKSVFVPSQRLASKHQRSPNHIRARNSIKSREKALSTNEQVVPPNETESESSSKINSEPPKKRFRPCSLKTAIATAKRLTQAHVDMLNFMRDFGREKSQSTSSNNGRQTNTATTSILENSMSKLMLPPPSPSVESNSAFISANRDPFDLFFTSMSESVKRLPADLASEGKLKVMQIIFDLEIRAQQRQNLTETPNTSLNNSSMLSTKAHENSLNESNDVESGRQLAIADHRNHQEMLNNIYPTNQRDSLSNNQNFVVQIPSSAMQRQSNSMQNQMRSNSPSVQFQQNTPSPRSQMPLPIILNNKNRRLIINNTPIADKSNSSINGPVGSPGHMGNGNYINTPNKVPSIRPVPIGSLTIKQMLDSDSHIKHIQLNSSTQSRIIPIDPNEYTN